MRREQPRPSLTVAAWALQRKNPVPDSRTLRWKYNLTCQDSLADAGLSVSDGIVFVLPRTTRPTTAGGPPLLETAKMLMAITPNGI